MGIKRYIADADNTITNAFRENLTDRGTKGNMGQSDILEIYSIYAQQSSGSVEKSRILVKFPIEKIYADRLKGNIPEKDKTNFELKLFNAKHSQTAPLKYSLLVAPLAQSWSEGYGIDMEEFLNEGASNWLSASDVKLPQIVYTKILATDKTKFNNGYLSIYNANKKRYNFWFKVGNTDVAPSLDGTEIEVDITGLPGDNAGNPANIATTLKDAVNGTGDAYGFTVSRIAGESNKLTIVNTHAGATSAPYENLSADDFTAHIHITGSSAAGWNSEGGDYHSDRVISHSYSPVYTTFVTGAADHVSVDITNLVEDWIIDAAGTSTAATALLDVVDTPADAGIIELYSHEAEKKVYEFDTSGAIANGSLFENGNTCIVVGADVAATVVNIIQVIGGKNGHRDKIKAVTQYKGEITINTSNTGSEALTLIDAEGTTSVLTEGVEWSTGNNFTNTAIAIATAVSKISGWTATPDANKINLIADGGTAAPTMAITNAGNPWTITTVLALDNTEIKLIQSETGYHGNTAINTNLDSSDMIIPASFTSGTGTPNYGVGIMLSGSFEDGSDKRSYYTKKFFARGSEFYLDRPALDVVWDSSVTDDRDNFFKSSRLMTSAENVNKLYLYNYIKGQLRDIPRLSGSTPTLDLRVYSALGALELGTHDQSSVQALKISTGIYEGAIEYSGSSLALYDIWSTGSQHGADLRIDQLYTEFATGSAITVKTAENKLFYPDSNYITKITNLKPSYGTNEVAIFRVHVKNKRWNRNIYTVAANKIQTDVIEDAYYSVHRIADGKEVVPFATGSIEYTKLSYDVSGSYFIFDMAILEPSYAYEIKFLYKINDTYELQENAFKFRVD